MSKQSIPVLTLSVLASAALTALRFVSTAAGVPAAGANVVGVTRSATAQGEYAPVDVLGTTVVETGAAIGAGAAIETDNQGRAVPLDTGVAVARMAPGQAAATDAGQFVEVVLIPN
jgi:uncharacterized ParB-like nuclease family protein